MDHASAKPITQILVSHFQTNKKLKAMKFSTAPALFASSLFLVGQARAQEQGTCYSGRVFLADASGITVTFCAEDAYNIYSSTFEQCRASSEDTCWRAPDGTDYDAEEHDCFAGAEVADGTCLGEKLPGRFTYIECMCEFKSRNILSSCLTAFGGGFVQHASEYSPQQCGDPFIGGDPHLKTWGGVEFDYMGECDLVFLHAPALDMDIHIRTKIRYDYSYIASAAIRIGDDILEVAGWGEHLLNGVDLDQGEDRTFLLGGRSLTYSNENKKAHSFKLQLKEGEHIVVKTFKDWVSIELKGSSAEHYGNSVGLLGHYVTGARMARDGVTVLEDTNDFGQEWQVRDTEPMLFQTIQYPQYPHKCILPSPDASQSRRLEEAVTREAAEKACAGWNEQFKDCVYDVMKSGDLEMAEAGGY